MSRRVSTTDERPVCDLCGAQCGSLVTELCESCWEEVGPDASEDTDEWDDMIESLKRRHGREKKRGESKV